MAKAVKVEVNGKPVAASVSSGTGVAPGLRRRATRRPGRAINRASCIDAVSQLKGQ